MISFGLRMQECNIQVPKQVVKWLLSNSEKFPDLDFQLGYEKLTAEKIDNYTTLMGRFSATYCVNLIGYITGITNIKFLYSDCLWNVRVLGTNSPDEKSGDLKWRKQQINSRNEFSLSYELSNYFLFEKYYQDDKRIFYGQYKKDELVDDDEAVNFVPDYRMTSELSLTGAQLLHAFADPLKGPEVCDAIYMKDYKKLRKLTT